MRELEVGDMVFSGHNRKGQPRYQPVYSFRHYHLTQEETFLQIYTGLSKDPLEITGDHFLFVQNEKGNENTVQADAIQVGDLLVIKE